MVSYLLRAVFLRSLGLQSEEIERKTFLNIWDPIEEFM